MVNEREAESERQSEVQSETGRVTKTDTRVAVPDKSQVERALKPVPELELC